MESFTWKYLVFYLLTLLLHSQLSFPSSFSSSLSSIPPCFALLQFNKSFSISASYCGNINYPKTASWDESKDCCSWDGVECDKITGHVISLDLSCSSLYGTINSNSSLFLLHHLRRLNLAGNDFNHSLLPSEFGLFKNLTHLNLTFSYFFGQIPFEISQLSLLVSLDLSYNNLLVEAPVWKRLVDNLTQLKELLLDSVDMSSVRPSSMMNLSSSMTTLSLPFCQLQGEIEDNNFHLPGIQILILQGNKDLRGYFPKYNWTSSLKFLDFSSTSFSGELPDSIGNLKSLNHLDLSHCSFTGSIPASLGNLTQITYLKLSSNSFTGSIPESLGNLIQLSFLDLSNNSFTESIPASLGNLTKITFLDLSINKLSGLLPSSLFSMPKLSHLDLHENQLVGPLPNRVSGFLDLNSLFLQNNLLNGTLPSWLFTLPSLVKLIMADNQFIGEIGEFKSNSLQIIVMGDNKLHGPLPRSISRLVNLTYLDLSLNNLSIMLELEIFSKLINLQDLDFSYNNVSFNFNNNITNILPMLQSLSLRSSNISEFPTFLRTTPNLLILDLSDNKICGQVPIWLGDVARDSLSFLNLSHNFLTSIDEIPWKNIFSVDLHDNLLQGPFPALRAPSLAYLWISQNNFIGEIPSLTCKASSREVLDLSHNKFSGMIPKCLVHSVSLSMLDLRMNNFHGTIPTAFAKRNKLRNLNLNGNQLEGLLPRSLVNCRDLEILDVGNNRINDTFPYWLEGLPNLQVLVIRSNRFHGHIGNPTTKLPFSSLRILDLSNNEFSGLLPRKYFEYLKTMMDAYQGREVGLTYMGEAYYQDSIMVTMKGMYIELERILIVFTTIDLSNNTFRGEMPKIIGKLKSLKGLNFSHNNLTGYITPSLGNLTNLEWLDLSSNKLIGEIPMSLVDLTSLAILNLSQNQLTGPIPSGRQFNTFTNDSYTGNLGLCGYPVSRSCNNHEAKRQPPSTLQHKDILGLENGFGWKAVSIGYGCGVIFGMFMGYLVFKIGKPKWLVRMVELEQHIMLRRLKKNAHRHHGRRN